MNVFVSYRRSDASGYAGRLHDTLVQRLGADHVFQDVSGIDPGVDFTTALDEALDRCDVVLAVIGPTWTTAATPNGERRLKATGDYVRLELARALARDVPIVPVLVGGAALPAVVDLPEELSTLVNRQAVEVRDEAWHADVVGLLKALEGERQGPPVPRRRQRIITAGAAAAVACLLAVAVAVALATGEVEPTQVTGKVEPTQVTGNVEPTQDASDEDQPPPSCESANSADWRDLDDVDAGEVTVQVDPETLTFSATGGRWREMESGTWRLLVATTTLNESSGDARNGEWLFEAAIVGRRAFPLACFTPDPELLAAGTMGTAVAGFDVKCLPAGFVELVVGPEDQRLPITNTDLPATCEVPG